jgi:hypothetical protein
MDAKEAKAIADRAMAKRDLSGFLPAVKQAAEGGKFSIEFSDPAVGTAKVKSMFEVLGYKVHPSGGGYTVSWG